LGKTLDRETKDILRAKVQEVEIEVKQSQPRVAKLLGELRKLKQV